MPSVPSTSPATGRPTNNHFIHTVHANFVDNAGRTLLLRGVNLSGSSKAPVGRPSYILDDFWDNAEQGGESFVGRPLNIDDGTADVHLARLRGWGFNLLRFPVTWEAIEHEGPGKYDYEYMNYTIRVLQKCREYGFRVYMDPHQDTWSRFSGGSGAPFWTLAACGINPRNITATQAAILHSEFPASHCPDPASLPAMIWSTNYGRLLSQTVFTLFFAGREFAPNCIIDGINIQDYLQNHYIEAMGRMADLIAHTDGGSLLDECVIGWDSLNEPFEGLCGWEDISINPPQGRGATLKKGTHPTPVESLRLGMGQSQTVENYSFGMFGPSRDGSVTIDPKGRKVWADPISDNEPEGTYGERKDGVHTKWGWKRDVSKWTLGTCIWAQHGVWDVQTGFVMRPDYFRFHPSTGEEVEFLTDFWRTHWVAFSNRIRKAHEEAIIFVQPPVFAPPPKMGEDELKGRCAYSGHYYDGLTLVTRHWNWFNADALGLLRGKYSSPLQAVKIGESAIRRSLQEQLAMLKRDTDILGAYPTVIGEIGTPFDMDSKKSYGWTDGGKYRGDYTNQERALDASLNGADGGNAMNWTVWTFCPDSGHEWGDGWNMEDLSLWSADDLRCNREKEEMRELGADTEMECWKSEERLEVREEAASSRAGLLRKKRRKGGRQSRQQQQQQHHLPISAAQSSLSLATLGSATALSVMRQPLAQPFPLPMLSGRNPSSLGFEMENTDPNPAGWDPNPYVFLTDGARAVRAFCRPWPTKVVGTVKDVKFEIKKATVKVVVRVGPQDRVRVMDRGVQRGLLRKGRQGSRDEEEEPLPTEIYIPLVHFAHANLIERLPGKKPKKLKIGISKPYTGSHPGSVVSVLAGVDRGSASETSSVVMGEEGRRSKESLDSVCSPEGSADTVIGDGIATVPNDVLGDGDTLDKSAPAAPCAISEDQLLVDVDVRASTGRWTVEGQTLKWWYAVPRAGEPEREYVIEIKRRGGAVDFCAVGGVGKVRGEVKVDEGCCEKTCGEWCVIA